MAVDPYSLGASIAAPVIGSLIGGDQAKGQAEEARKLQQQAYSLLANLEQPDFQEELYKYSPGMYESLVGTIKPALEEAIEVGPSAMADVMSKVDPRLASQEMKSLDYLSDIGDGTLSAEQQLALEEGKRSTRGEAQAQKESVLQSMAERGQAGSGAELIAQLQAGQAAADRASMEGMRQGAIEASEISSAQEAAGALAGQIGQRRFGEQSQIAQAKDIMDRFRTQNEGQRQARNIGAQNQAQYANLGEQQRLEGQRAGLSRRSMEQEANLHGTRYDREFALKQAQASALTGQAQQAQKRATARAQLGSDIGSAVGSGFSQYGAQQTADQRHGDMMDLYQQRIDNDWLNSK